MKHRGIEVDELKLAKLLVNRLNRKGIKLDSKSVLQISKLMRNAYGVGYGQCLIDFDIKPVKLRDDVDGVLFFRVREAMHEDDYIPLEAAIEGIEEGELLAISPSCVRSIWSSLKIRDMVYIRDNFTCVYCGGVGLTIDHVIPQSSGGTETLDNMVCCCPKCNVEKGSTVCRFNSKLRDRERNNIPITVTFLTSGGVQVLSGDILSVDAEKLQLAGYGFIPTAKVLKVEDFIR